jgi:hypothetical protein
MPSAPPSAIEYGDYQFQRRLDGELNAAACDSDDISRCFVLFADPQTCFHNRRVMPEKLTAPEWQCQVKSKLKRFVGERKSAKQS